MNTIKTFAIALILAATPLAGVSANDLDDGIALDEPINDDVQKDVNVQYIVANAIGRANKHNGEVQDAVDGNGNILFGPGAKIGNNVVIINNSKNKSGRGPVGATGKLRF